MIFTADNRRSSLVLLGLILCQLGISTTAIKAEKAQQAIKKEHLMRREPKKERNGIHEAFQPVPQSDVSFSDNAFLLERGNGEKIRHNELVLQSQRLNIMLQAVSDRIEPDPTKEFLRTLRLCAPCQQFERFGEANDGGYVMCMDGLEHGLVAAYSYGINGFDGWGMAVASRFNIPLNEYDCTNSKRPHVCTGCNVTFHGECIMEQGGTLKPLFKTLAQQLKESGNGNTEDRSLLLKIDTEGAEWQIFANEPVENLRKFRQLVVEYHRIGKQEQHPLYEQAVKKIEEAGFSVAHLHGNNVGGIAGMAHFDEYTIPDILEVTYILSPPEGCSKDIAYHLPQDMPNRQKPELPDAHLPSKL